jgi:hypothetical protein
VRISVSLGNGVSFSNGLIFGLLLAALAALTWTIWPNKRDVGSSFWAKLLEPLTIFTAALVGVSVLQWRTLDRTDDTFRAGERAFVFVTHNSVGWQRAEMINGEPVRQYPIVWENSGNSPTRDLVVKLYCLPLQPLPTDPNSLLENPYNCHYCLGQNRRCGEGRATIQLAS